VHPFLAFVMPALGEVRSWLEFEQHRHHLRSIFAAMQKSASGGADVAIVGAGITGLSIAWHLAQAGASVIIAERDGVGAGASGIQPGGVRQQWTTRVNCELARESVAFYRDIGRTLPSPAT